MMKAYTKICVAFSSDTVFDFEEVVKELETQYRIGYAGLFSDSTTKTFLVLQTLPNRTRMAVGKVAKICGTFFDDFQVQTDFDPNILRHRVLEERGRLRTRGGKRSKVEKLKSTIYLHINALGHEDVSHITPERLERLVGSEDEVVGFFDRNYSANLKNMIMAEEWKKFRRFSRRKVRRWETQENLQGWCHGLRIDETSDAESCTDPELTLDTISACPVYDPDSDSEGNAERKQKLLRNVFVERAPELRKDDFLRDFELLLLENPHNSNIIASTKEVFFKFFDGTRWVKAFNKDFFAKVTTGRILKAGELLTKLNISDFTRTQISSMVKQLLHPGSEVELFLRDNTEAVKDGILAAENQEVRLSLIPKKVVRVGVGHNNNDVVRNTTWEKLNAK